MSKDHRSKHEEHFWPSVWSREIETFDESSEIEAKLVLYNIEAMTKLAQSYHTLWRVSLDSFYTRL